MLSSLPEFLNPAEEALCAALQEMVRDCFQVFYPMPQLQGREG
jgi:hypothetical protein